jgi:exodeoxyribonuclease VII large subunit
LLALPRRRFDEATSRLGRGLEVNTHRKRARLSAARLSPATLSRRIAEARRHLDRDLARITAAFRGSVREKRSSFSRCAARVSVERIERRNGVARQALTALADRQERVMLSRLERARDRLGNADRLLTTLKLSHEAILERGYALVMDREGSVIKQAAAIAVGDMLSLRFADGEAQAVATSGEASGAKRPKPQEKKVAAAGQGSLF